MTALRRALLVGASVAVAFVAEERAAVAPTSAKALSRLAAGTLDFQARFRATSRGVECPAEAPSNAQCIGRAGSATVSGLGSVSLDYVWSFGLDAPTCPAEQARPLATTGRLVVAGKGELRFAMAAGAECVNVEPVRNEPQSFTITGGTGVFQSASGSGTATRQLGGGVGTERWTGTLAVPGVEFDVAPPTLIGARSKTVRARKGAKRVRVAYEVSASDATDGVVPVSCKPRSGSSFPVGRTVVSCSATDSSGNTSNATFRVVVRPTR